jgi:hypothetical protein
MTSIQHPAAPSAAVLDLLGYRIVALSGSWREETRYRLWSIRSRILHLFKHHTMIQLEEWDAGTIRFIGWVCWLCDRREP